jgi:hypothetical protein
VPRYSQPGAFNCMLALTSQFNYRFVDYITHIIKSHGHLNTGAIPHMNCISVYERHVLCIHLFTVLLRRSDTKNFSMTSNELKDALNRRLKKFETGGGKVHEEPARTVSGNSENESLPKSPDDREVNQLYRSGWNAPAPIPRSNLLPAPVVLPSPLKSEATPKKVCQAPR